MGKIEQTPAVETTNEASAEQIAKWKKEFGDVYKIAIKRKDGSTAIGYLKTADRHISSLAMSKFGGHKIQEAGEVLLNNCWLDGDKDIFTTDKLFIAACMEAWTAYELPESKAEKL